MLSALFSTSSKDSKTKTASLINKQGNNFRGIRSVLEDVLDDTNQLLTEIYIEELGKRAYKKLTLTKIETSIEKPSKPSPLGDESIERFKVLLDEYNPKVLAYLDAKIKLLAARNDELFDAVVQDVLEIEYLDVDDQEILDETVAKLAAGLPVKIDDTYDALLKVHQRLKFIQDKRE